MACTNLKQLRGARFVLPLRLVSTNFDWTGTRVRVDLREDLEGAIVTTFDTAGGSSGTSATASMTDLGYYDVELIAEAYVTQAWPDTLIGDIWVYRGSPIFGPFIVSPFSIDVKQPVTAILP